MRPAGAPARALITGGTGMIGSALASRLLAQGTSVAILTRPGSPVPRLDPIRDRIRLEPVVWDDAGQLAAVVRSVDPSLVFHLAGPQFSPPPPLATWLETTVGNAVRLLEALKPFPRVPLVYASTAAVYGNRASASESAAPEPATWLGATKAMAGTLLAASGRVTCRPVVELRLFAPYGPWERPQRLIPSVILSALAGRPIELTSGRQQRDYVYIDDIIDAFVRAASYNGPTPAVFNIGGGSGTAVREIVTRLLRELGQPELARFGALPDRAEEVTVMSADVSLARALLGWAPATTLDDGLRRTITWYQTNAARAAQLT
jgi:nucleoside-diphosphate-sugar epimerase